MVPAASSGSISPASPATSQPDQRHRAPGSGARPRSPRRCSACRRRPPGPGRTRAARTARRSRDDQPARRAEQPERRAATPPRRAGRRPSRRRSPAGWSRPVTTATAPSTVSATRGEQHEQRARANGQPPGRATSTAPQTQSSTPAAVTAAGLTRSRPSTRADAVRQPQPAADHRRRDGAGRTRRAAAPTRAAYSSQFSWCPPRINRRAGHGVAAHVRPARRPAGSARPRGSRWTG